jgi:hypothetical protein
MSSTSFRPDIDAPEYKGGYSPYDILKEGTIAVCVILLLTLMLAILFGSPDEHAITIKTWSNAAPIDFATTAASELDGSSTTGGYGAPYNDASTGPFIGPFHIEHWVGVHIPINTVKDFVVDPLKALPNQPVLDQNLKMWSNASPSTQSSWVANFTKAESSMKFTGGQLVVNATNAGPVPVMITDLTQMAQSGALDQALVTGNSFYTTDFTKPLLFISDGTYLGDLAAKQHLSGDQWGMMNETGSYPGQAWLWLYSFWYQIPPFNTSGNADILILGIIAILSMGLLFIPFIPGLRSIPRRSRVYRIIWREHYRNTK